MDTRIPYPATSRAWRALKSLGLRVVLLIGVAYWVTVVGLSLLQRHGRAPAESDSFVNLILGNH